MTPFLKPSESNPDYPDLGKLAAQRALRDAGIPYSKVQAVISERVFQKT